MFRKHLALLALLPELLTQSGEAFRVAIPTFATVEHGRLKRWRRN
ncbi:hypothetical protein [Paenibacillus sp. B-A-8]